jgi:hypothetical protein
VLGFLSTIVAVAGMLAWMVAGMAMTTPLLLGKCPPGFRRFPRWVRSMMASGAEAWPPLLVFLGTSIIAGLTHGLIRVIILGAGMFLTLIVFGVWHTIVERHGGETVLEYWLGLSDLIPYYLEQRSETAPFRESLLVADADPIGTHAAPDSPHERLFQAKLQAARADAAARREEARRAQIDEMLRKHRRRQDS